MSNVVKMIDKYLNESVLNEATDEITCYFPSFSDENEISTEQVKFFKKNGFNVATIKLPHPDDMEEDSETFFNYYEKLSKQGTKLKLINGRYVWNMEDIQEYFDGETDMLEACSIVVINGNRKALEDLILKMVEDEMYLYGFDENGLDWNYSKGCTRKNVQDFLKEWETKEKFKTKYPKYPQA